MANLVDLSSLTYCGEEAQYIYSKQIYDLDLRSYGITYMDGVKGKRKLYNGEIPESWQAYTCDFTPNGKVSLEESFIEPAAIKVNQESCFSDFWDSFLVSQTEISLNGGIPQTFFDWYFDRLLTVMAKEYQEIFWRGDTASTATTKAYLKVTDGIEKQLETSTAATKITGAALTVDNVIEQVEAAVMSGLNKAASAEVATDNYKIFMNYADAQLLKIALGKECCPNSTNAVFANYGFDSNGNVMVMGFQVVPTMQTRNTVIFGPAANLILGFDTYDSHIEYRMIDLRETTGENKFRVIAISNIAVGIMQPSLFVYSRVTE